MTRAPAGMDPKRTSGALRHGRRSFGARYVIQGFAIDEEHDLLFALGWPHLVLLLEDHPLDEDPVTSTIALWKQILSGRIPPEGAVDRRIWPRTVASNAVRILASPAGTFHSPTKLTWAPSAKGKKLLEKGAVDAREAASLLETALTNTSMVPDTFVDIVLLLEALVGTDVVLDAFVDRLETWSPATWARRDIVRHAAVYQIAMLLLRTTPGRVKALRHRLAIVQEKKAGGIPAQRDGKEWNRALRSLDVVIHGAEGARRSAMPWATTASVLWELRYVSDDRDYVAERFCREKKPDAARPDARLLFLGGPAVIDHQLGWWSKYKGGPDTQRTYVRTYGAIKAPQIAKTLADMLARSKVRPEVRAWLEGHRATRSTTPAMSR